MRRYIYIGVTVGMIHKYGVIIVNNFDHLLHSSLFYHSLSAIIISCSPVNTDSTETKTNH